MLWATQLNLVPHVVGHSFKLSFRWYRCRDRTRRCPRFLCKPSGASPIGFQKPCKLAVALIYMGSIWSPAGYTHCYKKPIRSNQQSYSM